MNDLPGRGDVNPYGIPMPNPHEREGPDEADQLREARDNIGALAARRLDEIDRLRETLRRLLINAERIFDREPVRDWGETLAEARAALGDTEHE